MSMFSALEEAIQSCKAEQAKINTITLRYREIIQSITPQPEQDTPDSHQTKEDVAGLSPQEKKEIEILERALEKASSLRLGKETTMKKSNSDKQSMSKQELSGPHVKPKKKANQTTGSCRGIRPAANTSAEFAVPKHEPGKQSSQEQVQNRKPSEQGAKWKSLILLRNRLCDQVMAVQQRPVLGRDRFMESMRATFPAELAGDSPDHRGGLANEGIQKGRNTIGKVQSKEPLAKQAAEGGTKPEGRGWNRWWADEAGLGPAGANGDSAVAPLPLAISYTTESELLELERCRNSVELLRQELRLEQALWDALSPQLPSLMCGPECPNPSVLRDVYSLLGEGGHKFPAVVLDTDPH